MQSLFFSLISKYCFIIGESSAISHTPFLKIITAYQPQPPQVLQLPLHDSA